MKKTTDNRQAALARNEELVVQELPDELLVYDLTRHKAHCLNKTSAFIWTHCDGKTSASEIAELMQKEWNTQVSEDTVWFALDKLGKAELLQQRVVLPQAQAGMSRRSAIRRLGLGALLVPVVMTIVAPTAQAGASVPPACAVCVKKNPSPSGGGAQGCPQVCIDAGTKGTCFGNDGCGGGLVKSSDTCLDCFNNTVGKSWVAA